MGLLLQQSLFSSCFFNKPTTVNGLYYIFATELPYDAQPLTPAGHLTFEEALVCRYNGSLQSTGAHGSNQIKGVLSTV